MYTVNPVSTHIECSLQLAGDGREAVEDKVLTHAVDPLASANITINCNKLYSFVGFIGSSIV